MDRRYSINLLLLLVAAALVAIGGSPSAIAEEEIIDPQGPTGGDYFDDDVIECAKAHQVNIRAGWWINGLQMVVETPDGATESLESHGYGEGGASYSFTLGDDEYITAVSGDFTPASIWVPSVLYSIKFTTNFGNEYEYGADEGRLKDEYPGIEPFSFSAKPGWQIVGFVGYQTRNTLGELAGLGKIGVITTPIDNTQTCGLISDSEASPPPDAVVVVKR